MNKLVIFDLDGVLVDSKEIHFEAFNKALSNINSKYTISKDDHKNIYNGLPTTEKLKILTLKTGLPKERYQEIWDLKQKYTVEMLTSLSPDIELYNLIKILKDNNIKVAVASNSIRETIDIVLNKLNIFSLIDYIVGNEDVSNPKPHPEMYWKCMSYFNTVPDNTVIFEDSIIGKIAVYSSKARLIEILNRSDLNENKILQALEYFKSHSVSITNKKINVLIPMAGAGSRFIDAGFSFPKPLIDINGKPMIEVVVNNLSIEANYIYLVKSEHYDKYNLEYLLNKITPNCKIIKIDSLTEGAASTSLYAKDLINNEDALIIANSDQFVEWDSREFLYNCFIKNTDGCIAIFNSTHPKWSYVKINQNGFVSEVAEKKIISDNATVGIYFWLKGSDYVKYAEQMIEKNIRTNNEFYICPVYNEAIEDNKKIGYFYVDKMWGIGTPEDLEIFLRKSE